MKHFFGILVEWGRITSVSEKPTLMKLNYVTVYATVQCRICNIMHLVLCSYFNTVT